MPTFECFDPVSPNLPKGGRPQRCAQNLCEGVPPFLVITRSRHDIKRRSDSTQSPDTSRRHDFARRCGQQLPATVKGSSWTHARVHIKSGPRTNCGYMRSSEDFWILVCGSAFPEPRSSLTLQCSRFFQSKVSYIWKLITLEGSAMIQRKSDYALRLHQSK